MAAIEGRYIQHGRGQSDSWPAIQVPAPPIHRRQASASEISALPPPRSRVKGGESAPVETRTLGAQGPKQCTRNCGYCGLALGHNDASCPDDNPKNAQRMAKLLQPKRKRGRPSAMDKAMEEARASKLCRSLDDEFALVSESDGDTYE